METKKVLGILFSLLFVGAFAFVLVWGITNFNKVQEGLSGTGLYTQEDLNNAYEDGYNTALTDKEEYEKLIHSYRDTITTLTDQVTLLTYANQDYETQITNLTNTKQSLENQVANLTTIKTNNETTIQSLNSEIATLEKEVETLTQDNEDKTEEITILKNQITNLQALVSQLQTTNSLNVDTINSLNSQITSLNSQISDLTMQVQNNSSNVTALNNKIAELEKSVAYYEEYISNLENGEQVVATFEFAGSVYNIQVLAKNGYATVTTPTSTDYVIFNYWTVDGVQVDLSTYAISTNTRFVANVTYKYDVKFMVDNEVYNSQVIVKNGYATIPTTPTKSGYEFDGWTLNGVDIVNPNTNGITANTTYFAKFTQLHTVTFMYEDSVLETQQVRNGNYASPISVENTEYKTFNGWLLNGVNTDLSTYKITGAVTFVADIIYNYDVHFMVDETIYDSQIIANNSTATLPANPTKEGYVFDGWTLDGINIINPETITIIDDTQFVAKFTKLHTVIFTVDGSTFNTTSVVNNNYATISSTPSKSGYTFVGWSIDGSTIIDLTSHKITENTEFKAVFSMQSGLFVNGTMTRSWSDLVSSGDIVVSGTTITECTNTELSGDLVFSSAITAINDEVFSGCSNLTSVTFADNSALTSLGEGVFENCRNLTSATFGANSKLTYINYRLFRNTSLNSIVIPASVKGIDNYAFAESGLTSITFEANSNLSYISQDAFQECNFETITLPKSLTRIDEYAFDYCCSLKNVYFEEGSALTKIYGYAFYCCCSLESIVIHSGVTNLYDEAFAECYALATVYIDSATVASLSSDNAYLLTNATTVYLKQGLSTSLVSACGFAKSGSTADGYDIYTI